MYRSNKDQGVAAGELNELQAIPKPLEVHHEYRKGSGLGCRMYL